MRIEKPRTPPAPGLFCAGGSSKEGTVETVSAALVRCPTTGRELGTGVEMDAATFERLEIQSQIKSPVCRLDIGPRGKLS